VSISVYKRLDCELLYPYTLLLLYFIGNLSFPLHVCALWVVMELNEDELTLWLAELLNTEGGFITEWRRRSALCCPRCAVQLQTAKLISQTWLRLDTCSWINDTTFLLQLLIDWVVVLRPTPHKIDRHFGDVSQSQLLAWYGKKTKPNTKKACIHQSKNVLQ